MPPRANKPAYVSTCGAGKSECPKASHPITPQVQKETIGFGSPPSPMLGTTMITHSSNNTTSHRHTNSNTNAHRHRHRHTHRQGGTGAATTRPKMNIAAQNLRGLGTTQDKLEDITREMDENNIHVLMITETWCGNRDEGRLDSGYLLLTSGIGRRSGCRGTQGVGFILSPQLAQQYEESGRQFCGHGGRLATISHDDQGIGGGPRPVGTGRPEDVLERSIVTVGKLDEPHRKKREMAKPDADSEGGISAERRRRPVGAAVI